MAKAKRKKAQTSASFIAENRKAFHDYFIEQEFEAGIELQGWEVKSLRAKRVNLKESYVKIIRDEVFLIGCHITPLESTSTHIFADPTRSRKLLLHKREIHRLAGLVAEKGFTLAPLKLYWKKHLVKVKIGLAKGKKLYDKRQSIKERDWNRDKQRLLKVNRP